MYNANHEIPEGPSKSQRKRDMTALQELGAQLTEMTPAALKKCRLPEALLSSIEEYNRLPNKNGARRRQLQYIGKVMRDLSDEELSHITSQTRQNVAGEKRQFMALEDLRAKLLAGDEASLDQLAAEHPEADLPLLQQLLRQARQEQETQQAPLASRKLFQLLRQLYGA